ncbi:MAG: hypothetical protein WCY30_07000, partial [Candidatus Neomarinimicrobiota bacterium]
ELRVASYELPARVLRVSVKGRPARLKTQSFRQASYGLRVAPIGVAGETGHLRSLAAFGGVIHCHTIVIQ